MSETLPSLEELEERVRSGDDAVTPEDIERARGLARFAQLRREAAEKRAEAARQAAEQKAADDAVAAAHDALGGTHSIERIAALYAAADEAMRALLDGCADRNQAIMQTVSGLQPALVLGHPAVTASHISERTNAYVVLDGNLHGMGDSQPGSLVAHLVKHLAADYDGLHVPGGESLRRALGNPPAPSQAPKVATLAGEQARQERG
ncbi:hypothetical protein [Streptomyces shenzhenensis]|uniref:hypothetical protein n=1 Tax=Streptomyces shenzhenensis TaxID=943815 RepID=UPI00340ACE7A